MVEAHSFRSVVAQARGPGAAVALIPPDVATALGGLRQMRVTGALNGVEFRSSTYPWQGRQLWVGLPKAARSAANVQLGDEVQIELTRDDSPRTLVLAPELEAAFLAEPELRTRFESLSYSRKRLIAEPINEAKKPETRAARLEKALSQLRHAG